MIEGLVAVMNKYNPQSPWLGYANQLATNIRAASATGIPPSLGSKDPAPDSILRPGFGGGPMSHTKVQPPDHDDVGAQQGGVRFDMVNANSAPHGDTLGPTKLGTVVGSGKRPTHDEFDVSSRIEEEMRTDAHGQAIAAQQAQERDDDVAWQRVDL